MKHSPQIKETIRWGFGELEVNDEMLVPESHAKLAQKRIHSYASAVYDKQRKFKTKMQKSGELLITRIA